MEDIEKMILSLEHKSNTHYIALLPVDQDSLLSSLKSVRFMVSLKDLHSNCGTVADTIQQLFGRESYYMVLFLSHIGIFKKDSLLEEDFLQKDSICKLCGCRFEREHHWLTHVDLEICLVLNPCNYTKQFDELDLKNKDYKLRVQLSTNA